MEIDLDKSRVVDYNNTKSFTLKVKQTRNDENVTKHLVTSHAANVARRFTGVQARVNYGRDAILVTFSSRSRFETSTIVEIMKMMQAMESRNRATRQQKDKARKQQKPTRVTGGAAARRNSG